MKILFLPNFEVYELSKDDTSILSPNKLIDKRAYWFFKYFPDTEVDVIDNSSPFSLNLFGKYLKFEFYQAFKAVLKAHKYDLIISHSYNSGFIFSLLRSLLCKNKPPHFIIDVGSLNGGVENRFQINLLTFALKSVSGLIYHSTINEKFYSKYFSNMKRIFIPFGTDPDFFKPFSYQPKGDFILSIGYSKRDYNTLIKAWTKIKYPLKIIGTTKIDIKNFENVELIPKISILMLREYIHNAKFIILPIENDNYSVGQMTLTQCMSMEKAVIVNNVPGVSDYIGDNCITIGYKDETDLVEKVNFLLKNPDLVYKISNNARKDVLNKYNEKIMAISMYNFIQKVISTNINQYR